ncbi:putative aminopeptidase [Fibrisoma limi BUZ 3]|uniref:Putative aminopeptidase n=1 Tax=Fibrisoma limi BUZ 3 TaxID=1185876 RepID=I2GSP8_9BACT|nr:M1 family metallopeptidase [Fibrisoma limi]CCH56927.1 putative aminopeptidase [Fibrisoma limi BUZ 3]
MRRSLSLLGAVLAISCAWAQTPQQSNYNANTRFEQLGPMLPTPNTFRTAAGAPGRDYFQNRADYDIKVELDDANRKIIGTEVVTYHNYSPDELRFIWLQLDQNLFAKGSTGSITRTGSINENGMSFGALQNLTSVRERSQQQASDKYGYTITAVKDAKSNQPLKYTINQTMMRIDLPTPLKPGQSYSFGVDWNYFVTEYYGRSGYEFFPKDGNSNYFIAHWFPRLCAYNDVNGWQNKQFLGQGEFTLIFGNYKVAITVPSDHVVGSTGECLNYKQVLSATQQKRMAQAANSKSPVVIVTQAEAEAAEKAKPADVKGKKTWVYKADNVRDFAFASSRKFIWDAMQTDVYGDGRKIWSMSFYSKEGNPLWGQYSTRVVEHTLKSYGNRTIKYPYPVAISCHATPGGGMEYPMISFNGGRPEADGTYSEQVKAGMIGVIIHEVGHNFFPMIVNSDERQWTWMDEGLNTFCQYLAEKEWDYNFPSRRGEPQYIVDYMKSDKSVLSPIMTSSDNVISLGPNAYAKPATALNILRETVMGRELFDYAFKEYARRWAFKSPEPADFFRTLEDASGVDLDWFWKGWFYGVEPVDQDLAEVEWFQIDSQDPTISKANARSDYERRMKTMSKMRDAENKGQTVVAQDSSMRDFYNSYDPYAVTDSDRKKYQDYLATLTEDERRALQENAGKNFYTISLKNKGGVPMPVIIRMEFEDGTDSIARFPAEIWRFNDVSIKKVIATSKKVKQWTLDPFQEIADIDSENNSFPRQSQPSRFQLFKQRQYAPQGQNPMQQQRRAGGQQAPAVQGSGRND